MRINSKGQVTIPHRIREKLGLRPHTEVEICAEGGAAVVRLKNLTGSALTARLKQGPKMIMSSNELLAILRDEPNEIAK